jgi:hypothetical protein
LPPPGVAGAQETPQQRLRRLLQAAKSGAVDQYWSFIGTVTAEMRAAARLAIDRELRHEPLDEFTPQEVSELAEGIRERVYTSFRRRQEKETRRTQEVEDRKRADQHDDDRKQEERTKKKVAFLNEARRRAVALFNTRSLSLLQRIQVMEEILIPLDAALTGAESLSEAYASIDAVLQARVADIGVIAISYVLVYGYGVGVLRLSWECGWEFHGIMGNGQGRHRDVSKAPNAHGPILIDRH